MSCARRAMLDWHRMFWKTDSVPVEIISGFTGIGWAVSIASGNPTILSPQCVYLLSLLLPAQWALGLGMLGLLQLVFVGSAHMRAYHRIRQVLMFLETGTWGTIAANYYMTNPMPIGAVIYPVLAVSALWAMIRLSEK